MVDQSKKQPSSNTNEENYTSDVVDKILTDVESMSDYYDSRESEKSGVSKGQEPKKYRVGIDDQGWDDDELEQAALYVKPGRFDAIKAKIRKYNHLFQNGDFFMVLVLLSLLSTVYQFLICAGFAIVTLSTLADPAQISTPYRLFFGACFFGAQSIVISVFNVFTSVSYIQTEVFSIDKKQDKVLLLHQPWDRPTQVMQETHLQDFHGARLQQRTVTSRSQPTYGSRSTTSTMQQALVQLVFKNSTYDWGQWDWIRNPLVPNKQRLVNRINRFMERSSHRSKTLKLKTLVMPGWAGLHIMFGVFNIICLIVLWLVLFRPGLELLLKLR